MASLALTLPQTLVVIAVLLILSILASKLSDRLGVPSLLFFLAVGMLAGSEGPGGIYFDDYRAAQAVGIIALVFILFAGGLDTDWRAVRPVLWPGVALATIGVLLTALLAGLFAHLALGFSWLEGMVVGAVVSSTDAAAVLVLMRKGTLKLRGRLASLLEFESGSNDPMAVALTVGALELVMNPAASLETVVLRFVISMGLGALLGFGMGRLTGNVMNRLRLGFDGLYTVFTVAAVLIIYGGTEAIGGNGFLAVYVAGLTLSNCSFIHKRSITHFHDGLSWLMQITMFLILGLLVFPTRLLATAGMALLFTAFIILVARPAAVFLTLLPMRIGVRDKAFVSWAGLRGAAPIVLAIYPALAGLPNSEIIFNIVFFVVLASVLLQGTSAAWVARLLRVTAPDTIQPHRPTEEALAVADQLREMVIPRGSWAVNRAIVELNLPAGFLVVLVYREGQSLMPTGSMVLRRGDRILALADADLFEQVRRQLTAPVT